MTESVFLLLLPSSLDDWTSSIDGDSTDSVLGSVTFIPNILPGGRVSRDLPVSFDAKRSAIASSTACCRLSAT